MSKATDSMERPDSKIRLYAFFAVLISSYGLSSVCAFMMSPPIEADSHIKCNSIISQFWRIVNEVRKSSERFGNLLNGCSKSRKGK